MSDKKQSKGKTAAETKELRRVFDYCANFLPKQEIYAKLNPFLDRKTDLVAFINNPDAIEVKDDDGNIMDADSINEELEALNVKIEELQKRINAFDSNPTKKIHPEDLNEAMKVLGRKCTKKEIQDMIWEVDENLDGCVDWEEFKLMFHRNITDNTGLEPFQLFNVVQFMMYDKDNSGQVTIDETMHMLFARYGKKNLESQMKILFGENLQTSDGDGELSFNEYLKAVSVRLPKNKRKKGKKGKR